MATTHAHKATAMAIAQVLEERIATLLGDGIPAATVAASLGCSESYISQLLSQDDFKQRISTARYEVLAKHNERDASYDTLEDKLLLKLDSSLPLMHRPAEILKALQVVNAAKRRGASAPEAIQEKAVVLKLVMPAQIMHKFTVNIQNQVIQAGEQELLTISSKELENGTRALKAITAGNQETRVVAAEQESSGNDTSRFAVAALAQGL